MPTNIKDTLVCNELPRDYLVRENKVKHKVILHTSDADLCDFNQYAKRSLERDNEAKRRSKDEAVSIHIITAKLRTRLNILFETQIYGFYGKPDFIIRLGKKLYIMVSTTRAVSKRSEFDQKEATRLLKKKINGLYICAQNLECMVEDAVDDECTVRPVLHILSPSEKNAQLCLVAYKNMVVDGSIDLSNIKVIITCIENHKKLL